MPPRRGEQATGNAPLIERVVRLAADLKRPVATLVEAGRRLELGWRLAEAASATASTSSRIVGTSARRSRVARSHTSGADPVSKPKGRNGDRAPPPESMAV